MFKWYHEHTIEIPASLPTLWKFYTNLDNWSKWLEEFESFSCETELKNGAIVQGKVKNKNFCIVMTINTLNPYSNTDLTIKAPFFKQNSSTVFKKLTPERTAVIFKTEVISFFAPFLNSYFNKKVKPQYAKLSAILSASPL